MRICLMYPYEHKKWALDFSGIPIRREPPLYSHKTSARISEKLQVSPVIVNITLYFFTRNTKYYYSYKKYLEYIDNL